MFQIYNLRYFLRDSRGVATLEFALLFLPFFLFLMTLIETMIVVYQLSAIDFITTNAAKYASTFNPAAGYENKFQEYVDSKKSKLLPFVYSNNALKTHLKFCRSLIELENNQCSGSDKENKLIVYSIEYKLKPIFRILRFSSDNEYFMSKAVYYSERSEYDPDATSPKPTTGSTASSGTGK